MDLRSLFLQQSNFLFLSFTQHFILLLLLLDNLGLEHLNFFIQISHLKLSFISRYLYFFFNFLFLLTNRTLIFLELSSDPLNDISFPCQFIDNDSILFFDFLNLNLLTFRIMSAYLQCLTQQVFPQATLLMLRFQFAMVVYVSLIPFLELSEPYLALGEKSFQSSDNG